MKESTQTKLEDIIEVKFDHTEDYLTNAQVNEAHKLLDQTEKYVSLYDNKSSNRVKAKEIKEQYKYYKNWLYALNRGIDG